MRHILEKDWITKAGLRAVVIICTEGERKHHRCGYVGVPLNHKVAVNGQDDFSVHGGVTYNEKSASYPVKTDGLHWLGFDCDHLGDAPIDPSPYGSICRSEDDVVRSLDYCVGECEGLARQIAEVA